MAATATAGAVAGIGAAHDPPVNREGRQCVWAGLVVRWAKWPRGRGLSRLFFLFNYFLLFTFHYFN